MFLHWKTQCFTISLWWKIIMRLILQVAFTFMALWVILKRYQLQQYCKPMNSGLCECVTPAQPYSAWLDVPHTCTTSTSSPVLCSAGKTGSCSAECFNHTILLAAFYSFCCLDKQQAHPYFSLILIKITPKWAGTTLSTESIHNRLLENNKVYSK